MKAERIIDGIPVNPELPKALFDKTKQKYSTSPWWNVPFVLVVQCPFQDPEEGFATWWKAWPSGLRYDTYCLDGGANNRPTAWGKFATLAEAIQCANDGPAWRKGREDTPEAFLARIKDAPVWRGVEKE